MKGIKKMKLCKNCNLTYEDKFEFCRKCGNKLEPFQKNTQENNIMDTHTINSNIIHETKNASTTNNFLIIALIIAALLVGGMGSYLLFGRSSGDSKSVVESTTNPQQQHQQTAKSSETNTVPTLPPEASTQQTPVNKNTAKDVFLGFHAAITDKRLEEAYNILSPEYQKFMKSYDNFARGYSTTLRSDIVELNTLHEDNTSASYTYKLKAIDRDGTGTKTQYFAGKAKLININGYWRLDSTEAKRLNSQNDVSAQHSRYNEKTSTGYPYYLNGDPNCLLVAGHMGSAWYLVKNSIKSTALSSNERTIVVDVVSVSNADKGNTTVDRRNTYSYYFNDGNGYASLSNQPINYNGPLAVTRIANPTGAMSYYLVTGKKWSKFGYGNDFYSRAN